MSEWISVKDRLPEKDKRFLTYRKYGIYEVLEYFTKTKAFYKNSNQGGWSMDITHWQTLEPPA